MREGKGKGSVGLMVRVREVLNFSKLHVSAPSSLAWFLTCLTCCKDTKSFLQQVEKRCLRFLVLFHQSEESVDPCAAECLFNHLRCYKLK